MSIFIAADEYLKKQILRLHDKTIGFLKDKKVENISENFSFKRWLDHFDDDPKGFPWLVALCFETREIEEILTSDDYLAILDSLGYCSEGWNSTTIAIYPSEDNELYDAYTGYVKWCWICKLIVPEFSLLYKEIFEHFSANPGDLYKLNPRSFEVLLDGVFRGNGYKTELGKGQDDDGIDIKLYQRDIIGETITIVQAKRTKNPIGLEAVAALSGVVEAEKAHKGLFITTSRYQPKPSNFASRKTHRIDLRTSSDVAEWATIAATNAIQDLSELVSDEYVLSLLSKSTVLQNEGKIVHGRIGYTMTMNEFCLILKDTKTAALLMKLPTKTIEHDGYNQRGYEVPVINESVIDNKVEDKVFRVQKKVGMNGEEIFWGNGHIYTSWDGTKKYFDYYD